MHLEQAWEQCTLLPHTLPYTPLTAGVFFVLFQNCFVPTFFAFPYEFLNHCINSYSLKNDFDWGCVDSIGQFGKNWHLNNTKSSSHEYNISLHFCKTSLISLSNVP